VPKKNEMKKGKPQTFNIERRTLNEPDADGWILRGGEAPGRKFDLEKRLLEFASAVLDLSEKLLNTRAGNHIAGRILRSGTSPYPNHGEAESAGSRDDFIHKLKTRLKELRETRRWGRLIHRKRRSQNDATLLFVSSESEELIRFFMSSVKTAQRNALIQKRKASPPIGPRFGETGWPSTFGVQCSLFDVFLN
jgi:four helix bundle protein